MTKVFMRRWFPNIIPLLVFGAALGIGGVQLVRCWGDENQTNRSLTKPAVETVKVDATQTNCVEKITFDDLKLDVTEKKDYETSQLPEKVKQLDGKTIRIRGFILPTFLNRGIAQFVLSWDYDSNDVASCIVVNLAAPTTIDFVLDAIDVEGVFSLRELKMPDGRVIAIYHLDGKRVRVIPGVRAPRSKNGC